MPKGSPISTSEYFTMSDLWEKCHVKQPCFIVKLRKCSDDCACFITRHAVRFCCCIHQLQHSMPYSARVCLRYSLSQSILPNLPTCCRPGNVIQMTRSVIRSACWYFFLPMFNRALCWDGFSVCNAYALWLNGWVFRHQHGRPVFISTKGEDIRRDSASGSRYLDEYELGI